MKWVVVTQSIWIRYLVLPDLQPPAIVIREYL